MASIMLVQFHFPTYKRWHKSASQPGPDRKAGVNFLVQMSDNHITRKQRGQNLAPYTTRTNSGADNLILDHFGFLRKDDIAAYCNKFTYPKMPTVHQMWVDDHQRPPKWSSSTSRIADWKCVQPSSPHTYAHSLTSLRVCLRAQPRAISRT